MTKEDDILATLQKLLTVTEAEYNFNQTRYLTIKLRAGEATAFFTSYSLALAPGASTTLVFNCPSGYVRLDQWTGMRVSQDRAVELTIFQDDQILPWIHIPLLSDFDFDYTRLAPYERVVKDHSTLTYTNHDALAQWVTAGIVAIFVRKDVWEKDLAAMNQVAQAFALTPTTVPPPLPSPRMRRTGA